MRHGFLGGTFDPIHVGHLDVARAAQSALSLDDVSLLPSGIPPHRRVPHASASRRFAMVEAAVRDVPGFVASRLDLDSGGPSYTAATLARITASGTPAHDIFFITGADAFREIPSWKDYPALLDRCHFVVVSRPGCPAAALRSLMPELASRMPAALTPIPATPSILLVDAPTSPVSSTDVRRRLADGESIEGLVPDAVAAYIHQHGLYRSRPTHERT